MAHLLSHTLVVIDYISQVVSAAVMGLSHAHRVMGEVDIAVIACVRIVSVRLPRAAVGGNLQKSAQNVSLSIWSLQKDDTYIWAS